MGMQWVKSLWKKVGHSLQKFKNKATRIQQFHFWNFSFSFLFFFGGWGGGVRRPNTTVSGWTMFLYINTRDLNITVTLLPKLQQKTKLNLETAFEHYGDSISGSFQRKNTPNNDLNSHVLMQLYKNWMSVKSTSV